MAVLDAPEDLYFRIAELLDAVRARDEFISVAAHELRNPMTPILLLVNRIAAHIEAMPEPPSIALARDIERLERAVPAYIKRATTLLDISRISSGKFHLELSEVDVSAMMGHVAESLTPSALRIGSPFLLSIQGGIVGTLDRLAIEQIGENLLTNAIKYGGGEPIAVTLTSDGKTAWLVIRDQGIGISADAQARIFARFERAVARSEHGGFGVGLWMVGRLVDAMGGTITVTSSPGEGSTFTVMLPLGIAAKDGASWTHSANPASPVVPAPSRHSREGGNPGARHRAWIWGRSATPVESQRTP
jgi:two-component system, OmpR family, sensor kinase